MAKGKNGRIYLLDELRGFAIICMIFFHAFYTGYNMFDWSFAGILLNFFTPAEPYFAALFIVISGISCHLSHSNFKRGLILTAISIALTLITWAGGFIGLDGIVIWFGILHLLAFCILFAALLEKALKKIHPLLGIPMNAAMFFITYNVGIDRGGFLNLFGYEITLPDFLYMNNWLCPFGFYTRSFYSADYFPILPWLFMFLCGYYLGVYAKRGKFPAFCYNQHIRPFAFVGKYTLWIYILHQPVIYGLFWVVSFIMSHIIYN